MSKSFQEIADKVERAVRRVFRLSFDSCAMNYVDHDAVWRLSSLEAHSTSSNERKRAVFHRDVVDSKAATGERKLVRDVNKKRCYLAFVYDPKLTSTGETDKDKTYLLPDGGNIITVGALIFSCAEPFLQPSPTGQKASGFHGTSFQCIMKCYIHTCKDLYANAVFSGSTVMFQRIVERVTKELTDTLHDDSSSLRSEAHAPNCTVIECDEFIVERLSSTGSTQHVCDREKVWVICRDVVEGKECQSECAIVCAHFVGDRGARRKCAHGFRVHSSIAKSEASVLIDQASKSAKELIVELPATVELGLCPVCFMMPFPIFSSPRWSAP